MVPILLFVLFFVPLWGDERSSSYPYLAGDTWRFFADHRLSKEEAFDPKRVGPGQTIFVEYERLDRFSRKFLPRIRHPFILITPNCERGSDNPLPGPYAELLKSEKVIAWFLQNYDGTVSRKIVPLPIGLANAFWPHGRVEAFDEGKRKAKERSDRDVLLYVNFSVGTNPGKRKSCYEYFSACPFATVVSAKKSEEYLADLARARFVISPPGNGLDCHRTWEALLLGAYPVVLSTSLNPLYEGLPVLVVESWEEVTPELLERKEAEFAQLAPYKDRLMAPYWIKKVESFRQWHKFLYRR